MLVTPLPTVTLRDLVSVNPDSVTRSPGLHVTDIISDIMAKIDPKRYGGERDTTDAENWQEAGFLWESILTDALRSKIAYSETRLRPGELTKDGIVGSPDAVAIDDPTTLVVEEYKCTWKSSRDFDLLDKRFLYWLLQLRAYCYLAETFHARLFVFHINGDYTRFVPHVAAYAITFTRTDLVENWTMLVNTARARGWL